MKTVNEMGVKTREKPMKPTIEKLNSIVNEAMYTLDEAATLCGVTSAGVRNWAYKEKIKLVRVGSRFYVTGEELKRAIEV